MEKWGYKSLEWIHKAREDNYNKTKNLSAKELIKKTCKTAENSVKAMGLKIVNIKSPSAHSGK